MGWTYTAHDGFGGLPEAGRGMRAIAALSPADVTLDFPPEATDDWFAGEAGRTLSVTDPARGIFLPLPRATAWKTYVGWGKSGLADLPEGLGVENGQWGSPWLWLVGAETPVTVSGSPLDVSLLVRNDAGSPWESVVFHLARADRLGSYGPTDSTSDTATRRLVATRADGFSEYRGALEPAAAGTILPSLRFQWEHADGNGPNSPHRTVIRALEAFPALTTRLAAPRATPEFEARREGRTLVIGGGDELVEVRVLDPAGRERLRTSVGAPARLPLPVAGGMLLVHLRSGNTERAILVPALGD